MDIDALQLDLPRDIEPGRFDEIPVKLLKGAGVHGCWHEIGLFVEGVGPFKGAGRARTLCLFTEELVLAPQIERGGDAA